VKVALSGGEPVTLADTAAETENDYFGIAVDAANVYWTTTVGPGDSSGEVLSVPLDGGLPATLASGQTLSHEGLAVDDTSVYWGTESAVMKAALSGGPPVTLASVPEGVTNLAIDAASVYWVGSGGVMKVALTGGAPTTLATNPALPLGACTAFAVDSTNVYWIEVISAGSSTSGRLVSVPLNGGPTTTLLSEDLGFAAGVMAVSATSLYWLDLYTGRGAGTGAVMRLSPK
jgi:hypothetical protein